MFEKEAEERLPQAEIEYCNSFVTKCEFDELPFEERVRFISGYLKGFKDGAEFGYNKANEWHYPSKGEYPKDMSKEKCCADCKHCVKVGIDYYTCNKIVTRDRITGILRRERCELVIDTKKCEFEDISFRRTIARIILVLAGFGILFFAYWSAI